MLNNSALEIVIGLVFIYLLYSLLATVLAEIIATKLGLRARNLREAVNRMLNDEDEMALAGKWYEIAGAWLGGKIKRIASSVNFMRRPKNAVIRTFYNHPEIKYLGSDGVFKTPSAFKAVSFSKTLLYLLNGNGPVNAAQIDAELRAAAPKVLGKETAQYVLSMWEDSEKDLVKFKMQLEAWFDRTMEQATEWYKRKIQIILLVIGFAIAWIFNADTIDMVHTLSQDKAAREQMVAMASAYVESHPQHPVEIEKLLDSSDARAYTEKMDTLLAVKKQLQADIESARTILGTGSWLPDSILVTKHLTYSYPIDLTLLRDKPQLSSVNNGYITFSKKDKWTYFFRILFKHWPGFVITALAVSLGAPFWFDMLNKIMKLRTSTKQSTDSSNTNTDNTVLPSDSN